MRVLLDTHILLWWLAADPMLPRLAAEVIANPETNVVISAASAWEIAIEKAVGRLEAPDDLLDALEANDFESIAITTIHALAAGRLPSITATHSTACLSPNHVSKDLRSSASTGDSLTTTLNFFLSNKSSRLSRAPVVPFSLASRSHCAAVVPFLGGYGPCRHRVEMDNWVSAEAIPWGAAVPALNAG